MFNYPVTLTLDKKDGGFVVTFKDVPEAITQGDTVPQALAAAKEALESAWIFTLRINAPYLHRQNPSAAST